MYLRDFVTARMRLLGFSKKFSAFQAYTISSDVREYISLLLQRPTYHTCGEFAAEIPK